MKAPKRFPTPWREEKGMYNSSDIVAANGECITGVSGKELNAYIIDSVNCREAVREEIIKHLLKWIDEESKEL